MTNLFGEFIGTMMLIIFGNGVVANTNLKKSKAEGAGWVNVTIGWGIGVMVGVFTAIACGAPQADLNPAVTLAKFLNGVYTMPQALLTMVMETAGGFVGGVVTWLVFLPHWSLTTDPDVKLGVFSTGPAVRNYPANLLTEIIGTVVLIVGIFAIYSKTVALSSGGALVPGIGPFLVGVLIWGIGTSLGGPTGYAINPARDLGPRIAHAVLPIAGKGSSDWSYSWVPVLGPFIGGVIAFGIAKGCGLI
jgi:glycerol uptake facilitator protein